MGFSWSLKRVCITYDRTIFVTHDAARNVIEDSDADAYSSIEIKITDTDFVDEITANIENVLYSSRFVTEETQDFTVSSPTSMLETLTSTMETLSFFLIGIAAISLLVGAIGIANTMFMSVMERTRLIGIFKSLGTKNSEIIKLFLTESAIIGLMGGLMGIFFGFILVGIWFLFNLVGMFVAVALLTNYSNKTLECVTGDVMGATNEINRVIALIVLITILF